MTDELQNQQAPVGGVVTPPAGEQNQTVQAENGAVIAPNGDTVLTDKEKVEFSQTSGEGQLNGEQQQTETKTDEKPGVEPAKEQQAETAAEAKKFFYGGAEVLEKLEEREDAYHCKLSDGTTAWVPKSIFGE